MGHRFITTNMVRGHCEEIHSSIPCNYKCSVDESSFIKFWKEFRAEYEKTGSQNFRDTGPLRKI